MRHPDRGSELLNMEGNLMIDVTRMRIKASSKRPPILVLGNTKLEALAPTGEFDPSTNKCLLNLKVEWDPCARSLPRPFVPRSADATSSCYGIRTSARPFMMQRWLAPLRCWNQHCLW